ncbi:dTDP-4-dehydrorhamnose reductase [Aurantiacibacter sediminis]|uniref:dTDP-4-dehydrorhamnose reductase n=1 Tax=Aurantiacibacter sediminis TaxID=2793064 RepID=A0ABS0MZV9_9SPHN|nr:dTDP-4-dehydrorhamnose reductase [Aurantiacibacter sediminis]MBH5321245.1 dTDP-4-dehydrorhamnose reductase [Aurantiacibacter sediminis]
MKVLVTGASGQLGRAVMDLAPHSVQVTGVDRQDCDLVDVDAVRTMVTDHAPDFIINCAAYTAVDQAESEPELARAINADAVEAIASTHSGRLVHVSTDFVFDGTSSRPYRPDDARNPLSTYGRTKAAGEDHLRERDLLIRTGWLYAAGGRNFVRTMLRLMSERDELGVVADQVGCPTWAPGLAKTIWGLIGAEADGTFHHSDAGVASWYDFAVAIQEEARAMGLLQNSIPIIPIATADYLTAARRPAFSLLDSSKTRDLLGDGHTHWRMNLWHMLRAEKHLG